MCRTGLHKRIYELDGNTLVFACRKDQECHADALIREYDEAKSKQQDILINLRRIKGDDEQSDMLVHPAGRKRPHGRRDDSPADQPTGTLEDSHTATRRPRPMRRCRTTPTRPTREMFCLSSSSQGSALRPMC